MRHPPSVATGSIAVRRLGAQHSNKNNLAGVQAGKGVEGWGKANSCRAKSAGPAGPATHFHCNRPLIVLQSQHGANGAHRRPLKFALPDCHLDALQQRLHLGPAEGSLTCRACREHFIHHVQQPCFWEPWHQQWLCPSSTYSYVTTSSYPNEDRRHRFA